MDLFDQSAGNAAAQLIIGILQLLAAIVAPMVGWVYARRALARVKCEARCDEFKSLFGARLWVITIRSKKEFSTNVRILVSLGRENNRIQRLFLNENSSGAEVKKIGSNIFVSSDLLPKSEEIKFSVKLAADDIPKLRSTHGAVSIDRKISVGVFSLKHIALISYERLMMLMLLFMLYVGLLIIRLLYLNFS
ncbi:hypothetical protein [Sphingopyxis sp.]|uniref:hypothetical protein n=1 Tax=Sphingopyxis sp. TaxID=1908224 RepID=UPI003F71236F